MHNRHLSFKKSFLFLGAALLAMPSTAMAQQIASEWAPLDDSEASAPVASEAAPARRQRGSGPRVDVTPYIEAQQILLADLNNGDVLTYSTVAVGVDTSISTRRAEAQLNVRYERVIGYDDDVDSADNISGIARGSLQVARGLSLEAGAIASRSRIDGRGSGSQQILANSDNVSQVYSVYAGPTLATKVGDLSVNAAYRVGYTALESKEAGTLPAGQAPLDLFDDSVSHFASASVGMQPGALPFGWAVGAGYAREDGSQLDTRFEGKYVRGDLTVPISSGLALVGGIGYEDVSVSERGGLLDVNGVPLVDNRGRLVTDPNSPRLNAYESDGIIWDVGVLWRPSNRTSFEARYGSRYGSDTYYGSLSYQPNENLGLNVSVYDSVSGFGGALNEALSDLPTSFRSSRNPFTGDLNSCAFSRSGGACLNNTLRTGSSAAFRARGVSASIVSQSGPWSSGIAAGYDRRKFLVSGLGAQANLAGVIDENYYIVGFLGRELDRQSRIETNVYGTYNDPGFALAPDGYGTGANAAYYRQLWRGLSASAAVGIDSYKQEDLDSEVTASALLGLRYSF